MDKLNFFRNYLPALKEAILDSEKNYGYFVKSYDWYIQDKNILEEMELFKKENYKKFYEIFDMEDAYFDSKSHYASDVKDQPIDEYKEEFLNLITIYMEKMEIKT